MQESWVNIAGGYTIAPLIFLGARNIKIFEQIIVCKGGNKMKGAE